MGWVILRNPQAFPVDQPLSSCGIKFPARKRTGIRGIHGRTGTATAFVAQDRTGAMTMSDAITLKFEGNVARPGNSLTLCDRPSDIFAAGFIGTPAKSPFEGEFDKVVGQLRTERCDTVHLNRFRLGFGKIRIQMAKHGNNMHLNSNSNAGIAGSCLPRCGKMEPVRGEPDLDRVQAFRPEYSPQESDQRKVAERFFPGGPQ